MTQGNVHAYTESTGSLGRYLFIYKILNTVCPGSSDPPEKIFNIFASENEVYTIY